MSNNSEGIGSKFGYPISQKLRSQYATGTGSITSLRVWRCSHFGGHQFAPTLVDLLQKRYYGHLQPEILD
ncbi:sucrase ferredoxin [Chlorogloeopsis sp. ULAP02]|uniref:sucrase ferredoxin n=1 Tax=Chlorogloeopsis sp. ULAP02 TaxID=3107926 RepID=UPI00398B757C